MHRNQTIAQSDRLLGLLTTRQYLHPCEPLSDAVAQAFAPAGVPTDLGQRAIEAEALPAGQAVGRLSRKEICRLARRISATWHDSIHQAAAPRDLVA